MDRNSILDISSYKRFYMDCRIENCRRLVFIAAFFLCATVLSRFTQDQSLTIRHSIWALMTTVLLFNLKEIPKNKIVLFFVGYLVLAVLSLTWAINPVKGLYEISKIVLMIMFFFVACKNVDKDLFIKGISLLGILIGGYGLYELSITYRSNTCCGTMGIRNLWASAQVLILPICIYSIKKWKWGLASSILIIVNLVLLMNRASILALFVSAGIFIYYSKKAWRKYIISAVIIFLIFCLTNHNFLSIDSMKSRLGVWAATCQLSKENPFFGIGIDQWEIEVPKYSSYFLEKDIGKDLHYFRPHNDGFWILSEIGIFGLICYGGIFVCGFYYAIKSKNILALTGLTAYVTIAMFSFPKERAFHSMMLIVYLSMVVKGQNIKLPVSLKYVFMIVLCFVFTEFSLCHVSERHIRRMQIARDKKQWKEVLIHANHIWPVRTLDIVNIPIKWYTGEAHYYLGDKTQAFIDSAKAFELNPNNIFVLDRMGDIYNGLGDTIAAVGCYRRALNICPTFESPKHKLRNIQNVNDGKCG